MKRKLFIFFIFVALSILVLSSTSFAAISGFGDGINNYTGGDVIPAPSGGTSNYIYFSDNDKARINKGDLQVKVVMQAIDTDRGTFWNADDVEFKLIDSHGTNLYSRYATNYDPGDGYSYTWDTGLKDISSGTTYLKLYFKSNPDGDNDTGFYDIKVYFYDNAQPDTTEIKSSASGTKIIGNTVDLQVVFDEAVNVSGTPRIKLNTGGYANYISGTGTNTLTFRYTVAENQQAPALNYNTSPEAIELNGGTIKDPAGNAAKLSFVNKINNLMNKNIRIDGKKPIISSISSNVANDKLDSNNQPRKELNAGDSVTLTVNFDEPVNVSGTASTIKLHLNNGGYAIAQSTGNGIQQLNFNYTVTSNDADVATLDVVELLGGTIRDIAGNYLVRDIKTIVSAGISIDNTPSVATFTANENNTYTKSHSTQVTITDGGSGLSGQIYKYYWSKDSNINNVNWNNVSDANPSTEVKTVPASVGTGIYYLHIRSQDLAGNVGYNTSGAFYLDNQGPQVTFSPTGSNSPNGDYNVTVTVNDELVTIDNTSIEYQWYKGTIDGNNWTPLTISSGIGTISAIDNGVSNDIDGNGKWQLAIKASDSLANESITYSGDFLIDKVGPSIEISPDVDTSYAYKKSHTINLTVTDPNYNNIDYVDGTISGIWYQWKDNDSTPALEDTNWKTYNGTFTQGDFSGPKWLHVKAIDNSGNTSTTNQRFEFDNENPTITFVTKGSEIVQGSITAEISLSDRLSGVNEWYYQWSQDGVVVDTNWKYTASYNFPLSNKNGDWYLSIQTVDNSGNMATDTSNRFRLDNMPPTGGIDIVEESTNTNVVDVNLTATDTNYQDEIQYRISLDEGATWSQWKTFESRLDNIIIPDIEGTRRIKVQYKDKFNNESLIYEDIVIIDKIPPMATVTYSTIDQWVAGNVTAILGTIRDTHREGETIVERESSEVILVNGHVNTTYDEINHQYSYVFQDNGRLNFTIRDQAGNETVISSKVDWIDNSKPVITLTTNGYSNPSQTVSTAVYVEDIVEFEGTTLKIESPQDYYYQWSKSANSPTIDDMGWIKADNGDHVGINNVDGEWYLHVKASDSFGNTSIIKSNKFLLDNTSPIPTVIYSNTNRTASPVTAYIEFNEQTTITKPSNGNNYYKFEDNGQYIFEFIDRAGNIGSEEVAVDWIDKSLPTVDVLYSATDLTNDNVTVSISVYGEPKRELIGFDFPMDLDYELLSSKTEKDGTVVGVVYEIKQNGTFSFTVRDWFTNLTDTVNVAINNIDKVLPQGEVIYSENQKTQNNIEVTIIASDNTNQTVKVIPPSEAVIKNVDGNTTYVFSQNGDYDFVLRDVSGNEAVLTAVIDNIDREPPVGTIEYTPSTWTSGTVTAVVGADEEIKVLNNNGNKEYTFYENGSFTFTLEDMAGNRSVVTAQVDWIDKAAPNGVLTYDATNRTNQDVEVFVEATDDSNELVEVIPPEGTTIKTQDDVTSYMVAKNGIYLFKLVDAAGNEEILTATINNIDKELPKAEISYSTVDPTNENVKIRLTLSEEGTIIAPEGIVTKDDNGNTVYEAPENGDYLFTLMDLAKNQNTVMAYVYNIDRIPPAGSVTYSTQDTTKGPVIVEVHADEDFKVANNFNSKERVFIKNESYTFNIVDLAGNRSDVKAEVTNIDNVPPTASVIYSSLDYTNSNVTATVTSDEDITVINNDGSNTFEFKENGTFKFKIADKLGNQTTVYANVNNIDKRSPSISFSTDSRLVFKVNDDYEINNFKAYDSIDGDITDSVIVDESNLDITRAGDYQVSYSVTDRAGNTTTVSRAVMAISPDSYRIFINGLDSLVDSMVFDKSQLNLSIMNQKGDVDVKWKKGYLNQGSMKAMVNNLQKTIAEDTGEEVYIFNAPSTGYYTFYIQDQERNTMHVRIFIKSIDSEGGQ